MPSLPKRVWIMRVWKSVGWSASHFHPLPVQGIILFAKLWFVSTVHQVNVATAVGLSGWSSGITVAYSLFNTWYWQNSGLQLLVVVSEDVPTNITTGKLAHSFLFSWTLLFSTHEHWRQIFGGDAHCFATSN